MSSRLLDLFPCGVLNTRGSLVGLYWMEVQLDKIAYFRALHFIHTFLNCVLEDSQQGTKSEDLVPFLDKAYAETLKAYHGWMARKLFTVSNYIIVSVSYHRFIKEVDKMLILVKFFVCGCYRFTKHIYSLLVSSQVLCDTSHQLHCIQCKGPQIFIKSSSCHQNKGDIGEIKQILY